MITEIKPFKIEHAYEILDRNIREQDIWLTGFGDFENIVKIWETGGPSYSLFIDDQVGFCAGVVDMLWQRGEAWTLLSSLFTHARGCAPGSLPKSLIES